MNRILIPIVLAILAYQATEAGESPWTLRFHGAIVNSSAQRYAATMNGLSSRMDAGPSGGIGLGAEYRFSDRVGLELSVLLTTLEIDTNMLAGGSSIAGGLRMSMVPVTLAVPFHLAAGRRTDIHVAPTFSHVSYLDIRSSLGSRTVGREVEVGSDMAFGAALGLDSGFGSGGWAFTAGFRYMKAAAGHTDIDPVIVTLGLAYQF